jgi:hypothetical protein
MPKRSSPVVIPEFTVRSANETLVVTLEGVKVDPVPYLEGDASQLQRPDVTRMVEFAYAKGELTDRQYRRLKVVVFSAPIWLLRVFTLGLAQRCGLKEPPPPAPRQR